MDENPVCRPEVEKARKLVGLFDSPSYDLAEEDMRRMRNGLLMTLHAGREEQKRTRFFFKGTHLQGARYMVKVSCCHHSDTNGLGRAVVQYSE